MALTLPSVEDLAAFQQEEAVENEDWAQQALEQARDLFELASGLEIDPESPLLNRFIKRGIMDMAWALMVQTEEKTETFSGHSSERIGSYSYTKAQDSIQRKSDTGVPWFDRALAAVLDAAGFTPFNIESEDVFTAGFYNHEREALRYNAPDVYGRGAWF